MTTNFFQQLAALKIEADWNITIKSAPPNRLLVSVLVSNEKVADNARKLIPPILLKGTAEEMDKAFFDTIQQPVQKTAALFVNMAAYENAQQTAADESRMNKEKTAKQKAAKEEQSRKFSAAMKKVNELEAAGKFREAYAQLPTAEDHPEQAENLVAIRKKLAAHFEQPGLF
jgi:PRTRC genetic system protein E